MLQGPVEPQPGNVKLTPLYPLSAYICFRIRAHCVEKEKCQGPSYRLYMTVRENGISGKEMTIIAITIL